MSKKNIKSFYALSIAWQLGFLIILPISGFLLLGFYIDKFFNTQPLFIIIGLFISIVVTIYEIYYLLLPLIKKE